MSFVAGDIVTGVAALVDESQTNGHFGAATILTYLKLSIHAANVTHIPVGYYVWAGVVGQYDYVLPSDFIQENHVRWRGAPVAMRSFAEFPVFTKSTNGDPSIYSVVNYPQTNDSNDPLPLGSQTMVVWPPPATAGTGSPPRFPTQSDYWFSMTYYARIPTGFTAANMNTYNMNIADEFFSYLVYKTAATVFKVDGQPDVAKGFEASAQEILDGLEREAENNSLRSPSQIIIAPNVQGAWPWQRGY